MGGDVRYQNLRSRFVLSSQYQRHFIIPLEQPHWLLRAFLCWYERHVLTVDTRGIVLDRPIFLLGVPRSGTTMLQDIICSHPDVGYITNTMHQFRDCFCAAEDLRQRLDLDFTGERYVGDSVDIRPGSANEGQAFLAAWRGVDPYSLAYVDVRPGDFSADESERLQETIRRVLWCFRGQASRFFNKNPSFLPYVPLLQHLFPDVKVIHLVRDPRMCANSMLKLYRRTHVQEAQIAARARSARPTALPFVPYPRLPRLAEYIASYGPDDLRTTALLWNDAMTLVARDRSSIRCFYEVRYEGILADPEAEIRKICEFCELAAVEDRDAAFWQAVRRIGAIDHTNDYGNFELVESICADHMRTHGYL